jgi:hypothetical protein
VFDYGADVELGELRWYGDEGGTNVIDATNVKSSPNYRTAEYRYQMQAQGAFARDDATPAWQEACNGQAVNITARFVQFRFTLRDDWDS